MLKKLIGDKKFYKTAIAVALPIMLQNGITNFVSLLDNVMVGSLGDCQLSGVAIVNRLMFIFMLAVFGAISGAGIFTAQFYGKQDEEGVRQTLRFKYLICTIITVAAAAIFLVFGEELIKLFLLIDGGASEADKTSDEIAKTLEYGKQYLAVSVIGLLPVALSQAYSGTMRETEHTVSPMIAGFIAVAVNCLGNFILIYGNFGAPKLGVIGAAIATVASRFVELIILIVYTRVKKTDFPAFKGALTGGLFKIDKKLFADILKKGIPLFVNETLWSLGISGVVMFYGWRGLDVVSGCSISSTIINVFNIAYMALGNAVGIIVGKYLGAGDYEGAVDADRKLIAFCVAVGFTMGSVMFFTAGLFPKMYNTTEGAKLVAKQMIMVTACLFPVQSFMHSCYFTLRSGGKTLITFIYDSVFVCLVNMPLTFCLVKFTTMPILPIYVITQSVEIIKAVIGFIMLKKRIWLNKIV